MAVLVWILAAVAAAVVICFVWPLSYACWGRWHNGPAYEVSIDYLLFRFSRSLHRGTCRQSLQFLYWSRAPRPKRKTRAATKTGTQRTEEEKPGETFSLLRIWQSFTRDDAEHLLQLLRDLIGYVRPYTGRVRLDLGFEEPEYNGAVAGLYYSALSLWRPLPVTLTIHWEEVCLDMEAEARGRVRPVQIGLLLGRYVLCRRGLAFLRRARKYVRRRKEKSICEYD